MRNRSTELEMAQRAIKLLRIAKSVQPATVRQIFYQASVRGVVEKTEVGYGMVQRMLVELRRNGMVPWRWITDNTRMMRKPDSYNNLTDAVDSFARYYRKNLWDSLPDYVEIGIEKDALSGVIYPVTDQFDVPLMVARGYSSVTFLHEAAETINEIGKPTFIYHLGDFDPSGVNAGEKIEECLREWAPEADITFERIAVNPDQIIEWDLPARPTKQTDRRTKRFEMEHGIGTESVELDAIDPNQLRELVEGVIMRHVSEDDLVVLKAAESSERNFFNGLTHYLRNGDDSE